MFSIIMLFRLVPLATILSFITAIGIPYLSALLTTRKGHMTGVLTAALALVSGICSDLALPHSDWKVAVGTAFVTWFIAAKWHTKVLDNTEVEAILQGVGSKQKAPAA